ncbi:MAG: hypothetical protein K2X55_23430, partial [Burkholderiaceae bacterium]|nr:hypothetical protein [Burkholderiaceae bacterium]
MKPWIRGALGAIVWAVLLAGCSSDSGSQSAAGSAARQGGVAPKGAAAVQFEVTALNKIAEKRIGRTLFEYTYRVSVRNNGVSGAANVVAELVSVPAGAVIVDGRAAAGNIGAGATVTPSDVVVVRIDRMQPFNPSGLSWKIDASSVQQLAAVKPAEVVVLSLADLGVPEDVDKVSVAGAVTDVLLKDGTLRFSTPGDTGVAQKAEFTLTGAGGSTLLSLPISTERPQEPLVHVEPRDDGSMPETPASLLVGGLGPNNSILGNTLTFRLEGAQSTELGNDSDGLVIGTNNTARSLKEYWTYDPATTTFTISGNKLQQLLAVLPSGALNLLLNFVSADGEFASAYEFLAIRQGAKVAGKLVAPGGAPVNTLAGKKILLRGYNSHMRLVAPVDANGQFNFDNVIPDTYQLTLNDLENPNVVSASAIILAGSTSASVSITYALSNALNKIGLKSMSTSFVASQLTQDGKA